MADQAKSDQVPQPPADQLDGDEDAADFAALLQDIRALKDDDTTVEHMDADTYRKGNRT
jgi:hypothetical protein